MTTDRLPESTSTNFDGFETSVTYRRQAVFWRRKKMMFRSGPVECFSLWEIHEVGQTPADIQNAALMWAMQNCSGASFLMACGDDGKRRFARVRPCEP